MFTHGREAILITDQARRIVDCNDAFSAITGYTREESLGRLHDFLGTGPTLRVMMSGDYAAVERITGGCLMLSGCQEH